MNKRPLFYKCDRVIVEQAASLLRQEGVDYELLECE